MQQGEEGGSKDDLHGKTRRNVPERTYGGTGGDLWDDGIYHGVREIRVTSGLCIDSIRVAYVKDGELVIADNHGVHEGTADTPVSFNRTISILYVTLGL